MMERFLLLGLPLLILASNVNELHDYYINQGYQEQGSLFRNQKIYNKDFHTVYIRKQLEIPKLAEYVQYIESNHQRFETEEKWKATRKALNGRRIGDNPDDYFEMIPTYVGSIAPGATSVTWQSSCFKSVNASGSWLDSSNKAKGMKIGIELHDKVSDLCDEGYILAILTDFHMPFFFFDGQHTLEFRGDFNEDYIYDLQNHGVRVFRLPTGSTMTVVDIWETIQLFLGALIGKSVPSWTAEDNAKFLHDHMGWDIEERPVNLVDVDESTIKSGTFLAIIRFDGLDPMLAWAMGAHTGHTTITLRVDGQLYVCESTSITPYWPYQDGIQMTPWKQWLKQANAAGFNVAMLPLNAKYQNLFDEKKAYAWFKTVQGLPYGFHNMLFPWIDTPEDNYPPPLSSEFAMMLLQLVEGFLEDFTGANFTTFDFWQQGLNFRMGTKGLSVPAIYKLAGQRGISFTDLVTMPEQDKWMYQFSNNRTGPSMVCDVFVTEIYKVAGIFGNLDVQGTEFTNWDVYTMNIFDSSNRPPQCVSADPDLPYCQLMGKYRLTLPDYNTRQPVSHMAEKCPRGTAPMFHKPYPC